MRKGITTILLAAAACLMVAGSVCAGIDYMSGPWTTVPMGGSIASTQYTSAAGETNYHRVLAARASGGVDRIYEDGGAWNSYSVLSGSTVYTDLSTNRVDVMSAYGARQGGGIDRIYAYLEGTWSWTAETILGTNAVYSSVASEATSGLHRILGAKAGGGVDWIYYDNGAWGVSENVLTGSYIDLFADNVTPYLWYGARADGGIDVISVGGGGFQASTIAGLSAVYSGIATSFNTPGRIFGAKASGGVDWIYNEGGVWGVASNVLSGTYADLAMDTGAGMQYYAVQAVPEPSSLLALCAGLSGLAGMRFSSRRRM